MATCMTSSRETRQSSSDVYPKIDPTKWEVDLIDLHQIDLERAAFWALSPLALSASSCPLRWVHIQPRGSRSLHFCRISFANLAHCEVEAA